MIGRRVVGTALVAVIAGIGVLTLLSCFGRFAWPLDLLSFGRQHLLAASIVATGAAVALRRHRATIPALLLVMANGLMLLPGWERGAAPAMAAVPDVRLRVLTLNVLVDNRHPTQVRCFLRASDADVVALQEVSSTWLRELAALRDIYPYTAPSPDEGDSATLVLSRLPIIETTRLQPPAGGILSDYDRPVRVLAKLGSREVAIYAVHPPTPRSSEQWQIRNHQVEWLADISRRLDGGRSRIMLGDFNTPPWSFLFTDLLSGAALRDATGGGLQWPTRQSMRAGKLRAWLGAPVDHVLVSADIAVSRVMIGPDVASDHLPVIADLRLAAPQDSATNPAR